jgi:hypothetical protein
VSYSWSSNLFPALSCSKLACQHFLLLFSRLRFVGNKADFFLMGRGTSKHGQRAQLWSLALRSLRSCLSATLWRRSRCITEQLAHVCWQMPDGASSLARCSIARSGPDLVLPSERMRRRKFRVRSRGAVSSSPLTGKQHSKAYPYRGSNPGLVGENHIS